MSLQRHLEEYSISMKVKFVAEVSSNHNKNLARCFEFIDTAEKIGCYGVKFQLFKIDELFTPEILNKSEEHRRRKKWELPLEFIPKLSQRCHEIGLKFSCTPFYLEAVDELKPYVDFYKIASYELLWHDLLKKCAKTGRPVVLSTGMANLEEVKSSVGVLTVNGCKDITVLHCVSAYPAPPNECNLSAIETMRSEIKIPEPEIQIHFGWSDHSVSDVVISRASYRWGATMIEFHLDLDKKGKEFKMGHCWLPDEIERVIKNIDIGFSADGRGTKQPTKSEIIERDWRRDPGDGLRPLKVIRSKL